MRYLPVSDMLTWCEQFGIHQETQWSPPWALGLSDDCVANIEVNGRQCLGSVGGPFDALYEALQITQFCRIMKRVPLWDYPMQESQSFNDYLSHVLYHAGFIPVGCDNCLEIAEDESVLLKRLMLAVIVTARAVSDDVYIVPDNGNMVMSVTHHDQLLIEFRSSEAYECSSAILDKYQVPYEGDIL